MTSEPVVGDANTGERQDEPPALPVGGLLLQDSSNAYIYTESAAPAEQVNLSTGAISYLVTDAIGSVRGIVSSSGTLSATTGCDTWGNPETSGGLTSYTPFGFAGGYSDPDGLICLINRYYDPGTGQFLSVDPDVSEIPTPTLSATRPLWRNP
jgi:RHS repeat-associated protein